MRSASFPMGWGLVHGRRCDKAGIDWMVLIAGYTVFPVDPGIGIRLGGCGRRLGLFQNIGMAPGQHQQHKQEHQQGGKQGPVDGPDRFGHGSPFLSIVTDTRRIVVFITKFLQSCNRFPLFMDMRERTEICPLPTAEDGCGDNSTP